MDEYKKHTGEHPIVGVNMFQQPASEKVEETEVALMRSSDDEKQHQIRNLRAFQVRHAARAEDALVQLQAVARKGTNLFEELMETVTVCSLGQITEALFEVGGQYRRNM